MDVVDGAPVAVPHDMTVTRPPSPSLSIDFSIINAPTPRSSIDWADSHRTPLLHHGNLRPVNATVKTLLPRLWDALSSPARKSRGKDKDRAIDLESIREWCWTELQPLDGEEGELIDDEACFVEGTAPRAFDFLSLLPPEIAVQLLGHLDLSSIVACQSVSRTWHTLADDNAVWRTLFFRREGWTIDLRRAKARGWSPPPFDTSMSSFRICTERHNDSGYALPPRQHIPTSCSSLPIPWSPERLISSIPSPNSAPLSLPWRQLYSTRLVLDRRWTTSTALSLDSVPGSPIHHMTELRAHTDSVYCLELDSARIVTGSRDRTIKIWTLTGQLRCVATLRGHDGSVLCLKFDKDWDVLSKNKDAPGFMVSGSSDRTVCVWNIWALRSGAVRAEVRAVLRGHSGGVLDLRIDSDWIVSCSKDAVIRVWDRRTLVLHRTLCGHEGPVNAVGLQAGRVVSASGDGKMMLWDIASGQRLRVFEGHERGLACIEFKGDWIVSGSNDCKIKIWSAATGECIRTLVGHDALVRALAFNPETGQLVSASYDKTVKVWDIRTGRMVREFRQTHTSHIFDVKFDARRVVSTSHDQRIVVLDFGEGLDTALFV